MSNNLLKFPRAFAPPSHRASPSSSLSAKEAAFTHPRFGLAPAEPTHGSVIPIDPSREETLQIRSAVAHIDLEITNCITRERLRRLFAETKRPS